MVGNAANHPIVHFLVDYRPIIVYNGREPPDSYSWAQKTGKNDMATIKSQPKLAKALHRTPRTIRGWLNRPSWVAAGLPRQNFDLTKVVNWCNNEGIVVDVIEAPPRDDPVGPSPFDRGSPASGNGTAMTHTQRVDLHLKLEKMQSIKLDREIKAGRYVAKERHNRLLCGVVVSVRNAIEDLIETYPDLLGNTPPPKIRMLLTQWYDRMCSEMMNTTADIWVDDIKLEAAAVQLKDLSKVRAATKRHRK